MNGCNGPCCRPQHQGSQRGAGMLMVVIVAISLFLVGPLVGGGNPKDLIGKTVSKQAGIFGGILPKLPALPKIGLPFAKTKGKGKGGYACPVQGKVRFSDTWGAPRSGGRRHKGVDMMAAHGTRLVAVTNARVARAGWNTLGGLGVTIRDKRGTEFYYAHLSRSYVRAGQRVKRGQLLGRVGKTGNARFTAPHLHFEIRPHGTPVNPTGYVRRWC